MKEFQVISVNVSVKKGEKKVPVERIELRENHGIVGDAHAGAWHRQVSLLADEDIDAMRGKGMALRYGDFAENITTRGIDLASLPVGARITVGAVVLEITQIGKECHHGCAIRRQIGDCVMPRRGIFAKVIAGGVIENGCSGTYDI